MPGRALKIAAQSSAKRESVMQMVTVGDGAESLIEVLFGAGEIAPVNQGDGVIVVVLGAGQARRAFLQPALAHPQMQPGGVGHLAIGTLADGGEQIPGFGEFPSVESGHGAIERLGLVPRLGGGDMRRAVDRFDLRGLRLGTRGGRNRGLRFAGYNGTVGLRRLLELRRCLLYLFCGGQRVTRMSISKLRDVLQQQTRKILRTDQSRGRKEAGKSGWLFVIVVGRNRLQIVSFANLIAVQTPDIVDAIPTGNDFRPGVLAGVLHKYERLPLILFTASRLSSLKH